MSPKSTLRHQAAEPPKKQRRGALGRAGTRGLNYLKHIGRLCKQSGVEWMTGDTPRLGAALAYYTVFAIAPLFVIVLRISSVWFGEQTARRELFGQLQALAGPKGAEAIAEIVVAASSKPLTGLWATCLAVVTLLVAASGVFVELQASLNTIWKVPARKKSTLWRFVRTRLLSFAMVLGIGFVLLVSLVVSAALAAVGNVAMGFLPAGQLLWSAVNLFISLGVITVLFAMILKILPDAKIRWRDVWAGGFITALLFSVGKQLLGVYLGRSSVTSAYGAMGSLIIVLLWVYYSAQILFLGAHFTRLYASHRSSRGQTHRSAR